jgi:chromosome segregation ATPase
MQKDMKAIFGDHHGLDERSLDSLTKALEKSNLPGFDYIEFKQALHRLQEMDMDETTAFKSAFATASTMGLTKEKLLKTTTHYKKVLIKEKQQFDQALKKQMEQRVNSKLGEVEKLKKQIVSYQEKIKELQEKIVKAQDTIDHADEHIQAAKEKIESTKDGFEHTLQSIVNQIDKDIENINTYL